MHAVDIGDNFPAHGISNSRVQEREVEWETGGEREGGRERERTRANLMETLHPACAAVAVAAAMVMVMAMAATATPTIYRSMAHTTSHPHSPYA